MTSRELLEDPGYQTAIRLSKIILKDDAYYADLIQDMASGGELALALYHVMLYCVKHDIPVTYDDYKILQIEFSHEDEPDWDPDLDDVADPNEAEVFKKLKIADE